MEPHTQVHVKNGENGIRAVVSSQYCINVISLGLPLNYKMSPLGGRRVRVHETLCARFATSHESIMISK